MSRLFEHDLHLRTNGHANPITSWPVQAVDAPRRVRWSWLEMFSVAIACAWVGLALLALVLGLRDIAVAAFHLLSTLFGGS